MRLSVKTLVPACLIAVASAAGLQSPAAATTGAAAPEQTTRTAASSGGVPTVALTFDDGTADHLAAAKMLSRRGLKGTFYVNSGRLGGRGFLSVAALRSIAKLGHEIGGHTLTHPHLPDQLERMQQTEICDDRRALLDLGFEVRSFAYPFGDYDEASKLLAMRCGYTTARGINGLYRPDSCRSCPVAETLPPADLAAVRATSQTRLPRTADTLEDFVTRAQDRGRGLVTFVFHEIRNNPKDQYATAPKELAAFLDWLAKQKKAGKVTVRTIGELVGGRVWPVPDGM